ncbi:MAG: hypothetical protein AAF304_08570 [Pseudomonadota bacterium]
MLAQVILILALLLLLVGMIMVLLDAFQESFLWGLLVMIVPPLFVPVYSFAKWARSQARNGFALSLIGLVMAGVGIYGGALQGLPILGDHEIVSNIPTAVPDNEPLPNEEEAAKVELDDGDAYDPMLSTDKDRFTSSEIEPLAPEEDKTVKNFAKNKPRAIKVPLENVSSSIGAVVEITFKDGNQDSGTLVATSEDSLTIEQAAGGGTVSYEYAFEKIQSVVRYTRPKKAAETGSQVTPQTVTP